MLFQEFEEVVHERKNVPTEEALMEKIITNPIHAYKMMKRFAVDWQLIEKDLQTEEWSDVEFMLKKKRLGKKRYEPKSIFLSFHFC